MVAATVVVLWAVIGVVNRFPHWWETTLYAVTASVTFVMVFVIQHTQARQVSAMQRKLDELVRAEARADNALIAAEEAPDEEIEAMTNRSLVDRGQVLGGAAPAPMRVARKD